jgi:hypothetical protein
MQRYYTLFHICNLFPEKNFNFFQKSLPALLSAETFLYLYLQFLPLKGVFQGYITHSLNSNRK